MLKGNSAKITIKGYTSPLHTAEYNYNLASRRISSFKNYIKEYKNGIFLPFIYGTSKNKATLEFIDAPIGKNEINSSVSDNAKDKRNSIYSKEAALERRIQLIHYESNTYSNNLPKLELATDIINFEKIKKNNKKVVYLQFTNSGNELLIIDSVICNSPNIKISVDKKEIEKNRLYFIKVELNSAGLKDYFDSQITIISNSKKQIIKLKAKIEL